MEKLLLSYGIFSHGDKYTRSETPCQEEFQKDSLFYQERCLSITGQLFFNCNKADQVHMCKCVSFMGLVIYCLTSLDRIETSHHNILAYVMLLAIAEGKKSNSDCTAIWKSCCLKLLPKDYFGFRFRLPEYCQLCLSVLSVVTPNKEHLAYYMTKWTWSKVLRGLGTRRSKFRQIWDSLWTSFHVLTQSFKFCQTWETLRPGFHVLTQRKEFDQIWESLWTRFHVLTWRTDWESLRTGFHLLTWRT